MQMQLSLSQSIRQELRQEINLAQIIELTSLIAVPDEVMNNIAGAVTQDPEKVESILQNRKNKYIKDDIGSKVQTLYSSLISPNKDKTVERAGLIIAPDLRELENFLGDCKTSLTPDAVYVGKTSQKPEVIFSDHLNGALGLSLLQMDAAKYPETSRLIERLKNFDDWKRRTLRDAYVALGEIQREYFECFNRNKFHVFTQENLAAKLNIDSSTVSRILANRLVEARNVKGEQKYFLCELPAG